MFHTEWKSVYGGKGEAWYSDPEFQCRHRTDGPAVVWADGYMEYWIDGKRHRIDGPSVIKNTGATQWHFEGERLDQDEEKFCKAMEEFLAWEVMRLFHLWQQDRRPFSHNSTFLWRMIDLRDRMRKLGIRLDPEVTCAVKDQS